MLLSMTGFGRASRSYKDKNISVEIRALNSKTTDIRLKLPFDFKEKDTLIRKIVTEKGERGKIDVAITIQSMQDEDTNSSVLNAELFKKYYRQLQKLNTELNAPEHNLTEAVMRLPNVLVATEESAMEDEEWTVIQAAIVEAMDDFTRFRSVEGAVLEEELRLRTNNIQKNLNDVTPFETERIVKVRQRLHQSLEEFWGRDNVDENRFEQEVLFYLDKMDITEEKVRLDQHCKYFLEQFDDLTNISKGRQLNFISQEMGREINTLGAKAYSSEIQRLVVQMKDELEKIKEQLANAV